MNRPMAAVLLAAALLGLGGCANFKAMSDFARQTGSVTGLVRAELTQLDAICIDEAELTIVVNAITDDEPLATCRSYRNTQEKLAAVTLDVLDDYAGALAAIANDETFDVTSDAAKVRSQLGGLTDASGLALVSPREVGAISGVAGVLADLAAEPGRRKAVRRLVDEKPNLAVAARLLRSFFTRDAATAPAGGAAAPYANIVALTRDSMTSTERLLGSRALREAEPIRSVELLRMLRNRKKQLEQRSGTEPDKVPVALVAAIDAWLAALDSFSEEALKPDAPELQRQIKSLRGKAQDAKAALQAAR